jgi:hypothetical protein
MTKFNKVQQSVIFSNMKENKNLSNMLIFNIHTQYSEKQEGLHLKISGGVSRTNGVPNT